MKRIIPLLAPAVLCALLLSSCTMLPEEASFQTSPVVKPYVAETFPTMEVMQGDLYQQAKVICSFVPMQNAALAFRLSDEPIDKVLVNTGDQVEEGQLLAQLRLGDLPERMEDVQRAMDEMQVRLSYLQKQYELALKRHDILAEDLSPAEMEEALAQLQADYALRSQDLLDQLALQRMTLECLPEDIALRQIRAPFAGTVTKAIHFEEGELSSLNTSVITLADSTQSLFKATTEHWDKFIPGDSYDIVVGEDILRAVVADHEQLGLTAKNRIPGKRGEVYLALTEQVTELKTGKIGNLMLTLAEYPNALYLPEGAISHSNGQPIVYYQREDGMKAIKQVETGVTIDGYTVILSGVEAGEVIIADQEGDY